MLSCPLLWLLHGGHYHPFYLGQLLVSREESFSGSLNVSLTNCEETTLDEETCPLAEKALVIKIGAELAPVTGPWEPDPVFWSQVDWRLSQTDPVLGGGQVEMERIVTESQSAEFVRYYSPSLGMNDSRWLLSVRAASSADGYRSLPPKAGLGPGIQSFLYKEEVGVAP